MGGGDWEGVVNYFRGGRKRGVEKEKEGRGRYGIKFSKSLT